MTYGLRVWAPSGVRTFDSTGHAGGALIDILDIPSSSASGFKDYTSSALYGRALYVIQMGYGPHSVTTSTASGFPRLSWSRPSDPLEAYPATFTRIFVFAK